MTEPTTITAEEVMQAAKNVAEAMKQLSEIMARAAEEARKRPHLLEYACKHGRGVIPTDIHPTPDCL